MNRTALATRQSRSHSLSLIQKLSKKMVLKMMANIHHGQIRLQDGFDSHLFGKDDTLQTTLHVHSQDFYPKVLFGGSIGAGESYRDRLWDTDDLTRLVRIMVRNKETLDRMDKGFSMVTQPLRIISHILRENRKNQSRKNILSHYDISNTMYSSFLDESMMYSSAIYPEENSSLEEASTNKLDTICRKLRLSADDHIVEIGSGWGGFAIYAAKNYGCRVTTTTISDAQFREAERRIREAGLQDKIVLLKKDYRDLTGKFDKLVSIEMIEAVGHRYLPHFFKKCGDLLKRNGIMLLQAITIRDQEYNQYVKSVDFIQHHIFPGGCLPSNNRMMQLLSTKTDMVVRSIEDFGTDYAKTLRDWRKRFLQAYPSLKRKGFDERFKRLWEFYFCYCEGGFLERSISVVHLLATRPEYRKKVG